MITVEDIDFQHDVLILRVRGDLITLDDLRDYLAQALHIYHRYQPRCVLLVETEINNQLKLLDNFDFADWLSESQLIKELEKIAIISAERDLDSNRDFANFLANRGIEFRVFLDKKEALDWFS
ncbi:MAG: STAS/SEC14 domain-containing protein [Kangiellaceae bacterium]|nr:STAS/SEC14 domain-containing protein [Kangiellaceae bacterium]MCW9000289.1 STAS/SEC14 domain-containing protein [Kangiellaceae bacterium]